jgi:hypothetical protein
MSSPALALDAAVAQYEDDELGEETLAPPLGAAAAVGGHKTISFFGALRRSRKPRVAARLRLRARRAGCATLKRAR